MATQAWAVKGTMCSDNEEKVDGLSVIHTDNGEFVAFADPQYKHLIAAAPQMHEILDLLKETIVLNKDDMKPGIYNYLNDILERVLPLATAPEPALTPEETLAEEYEAVRYHVYAFGAAASRYQRKANAARKDHTRQAWQKKADEERSYAKKNQQRLVVLDAMMQEQN